MGKEIVYWSYCNPYTQIRVDDPVNVFTNHFKKQELSDLLENYGQNYSRCPSVRDSLRNTFGLKSIYDYSYDVVNDSSDDFDQEFYDSVVMYRDAKSKLASFVFPYIFFAESDNLEMEMLPAFMENNAFTKSANLVVGVFDVGQYFRGLDIAFHAKENIVNVEEDDIFAYVRFNTKKKIEFKRFEWTEELSSINSEPVVGIKQHRSKTFKPLQWYYDKQHRMKTKQKALKEIKKNLI